MLGVFGNGIWFERSRDGGYQDEVAVFFEGFNTLRERATGWTDRELACLFGLTRPGGRGWDFGAGLGS